MLSRRSRDRLHEGGRRLRRRSGARHRSVEAEGVARAWQARERRRPAVSARRPPWPRRPRCRLQLASALLHRGAAKEEGLTTRLAALVAIVILGGLATPPLWAQAPVNMPPGEGREVVATACTQCHALRTVVTLR